MIPRHARNPFLFASLLAFELFFTIPPASAAADEPAAPTYTAFFEFRRIAPDGVETITGNLDREVPISLPPAFSPWSCVRTRLIVAKDFSYQSVKCKLGDTETIMPLVCSTTSAEDNTQSITLRRHTATGGSVQVTFQGVCKSVRNVPAPGTDGF